MGVSNFRALLAGANWWLRDADAACRRRIPVSRDWSVVFTDGHEDYVPDGGLQHSYASGQKLSKEITVYVIAPSLSFSVVSQFLDKK